MKNLITYGKIFHREKFEEVRNEISFANKPEKGGLWCSPENSVYGWKDLYKKLKEYEEEKANGDN